MTGQETGLYGQPFVVFPLRCECGVAFEVHGKVSVGTGGWSGWAKCPKCRKVHYVPAEPLGLVPAPPEPA